MCRCVQYRCFTVTVTAFLVPTRHAPAPVAWQLPRQFAGILHANAAAPPHTQPAGNNWLALLDG